MDRFRSDLSEKSAEISDTHSLSEAIRKAITDSEVGEGKPLSDPGDWASLLTEDHLVILRQRKEAYRKCLIDSSDSARSILKSLNRKVKELTKELKNQAVEKVLAEFRDLTTCGERSDERFRCCVQAAQIGPEML